MEKELENNEGEGLKEKFKDAKTEVIHSVLKVLGESGLNTIDCVGVLEMAKLLVLKDLWVEDAE